MRADSVYRALNDFQQQVTLVASAAEDLEDASVAMRERNQDQVREILRSGARKLRRSAEAGARLAGELRAGRPGGVAASGASGARGRPVPGGAAEPGEAYSPIPVPTQELTAPREREALEEQVRTRLRLLYGPYVKLMEADAEMTEVQGLVRSCRDAVNEGALRKAALSVNAAAELMGRLLAAEGAQPAAQ